MCSQGSRLSPKPFFIARLSNLLCKQTDHKHCRLCGPCGLNFSIISSQSKTRHRKKQKQMSMAGTYLNLIIIEFSGALTSSCSSDFFQLLRSMKTSLSALPIQNHPKLLKHKQLTGTHRAPHAKSTQLPQEAYNFPWGIMFGLAGLLEEGDFTDLSLLCNNELLITEGTSGEETSRLEFLGGRNAPSPNSCSQHP